MALSGGAAWGFANGGVLEVLERENLKPDYIAGSSMGAIVASLHATGHGSKTMRELIASIKPAKIAVISDRFLNGGLHGGFFRQNLHAYLQPLLGDRTIGECEVPFVCIAGRVKEPLQWSNALRKGFTKHVLGAIERYTFPPETLILDAVMASSAIPVLFSPHRIGNDEFIDLLNFGALPSRTLREMYEPDIVIGTDTAPRHTIVKKLMPKTTKDFLDASDASLEASKKACDLIIEPDLSAGYFRFDKALKFYEEGKTATEKVLPEIMTLIA